MSEIDRDLVVRWIEALESGRYEQTTGVLHRPGNGYCCLGVLCDVIDPTGWGEDSERIVVVGGGSVPCLPWRGERAGLPADVRARVGLFSETGLKHPHNPVVWEIGDGAYPGLAHANDEGSTFAQIAAALRDHYQIPNEATS